jgi:hypothetical protein
MNNDLFIKYGITKTTLSMIVIIILLCVCLYLEFADDDDDIGDNVIEAELNKEVKKIIKLRNKPLKIRMLESSKDGLLRGFVFGGLSGGLAGSVSSAAIFGIANPFVIFINDKKNGL